MALPNLLHRYVGALRCMIVIGQATGSSRVAFRITIPDEPETQ